jgi:LysR family transcriptional regulator of gallate degradation
MSEMDIAHEQLFEDSLSLVVRKGHPLARKRGLSLRDLKNMQWVLPRSGTPARGKLDRVISEANLGYGGNSIESNALLTMRSLLMESDRVGIITRNQIYFDELADLLEVLPIELPDTKLSIGIRTRCDAMLPLGVHSLLRHLRAIGEKISHGRQHH